MSRLARLGAEVFAIAFGAAAVFALDALARPSNRFFRVADSKEPLKTCACNLLTASDAAAGAVKRA